MMDVYQLSGRLDSVDIATLLGAAEAASFERERDEVVRAVAGGRSDPEQGGAALADLVRRYPALADRVLPDPAAKPSVATPPLPETTPPDLDQAAPAEAPAAEAAPAPPPSPPPSAATDRAPTRWSPELRLTALKEAVTTIIGLAIIGFTLYMSVRAAGARAADDRAYLRDLLALLLSLSGVVLGYYFGRVPGEARASSAEQRAQHAEARTQAVGDRAEHLAESLDDAVTTSTRAGDDATADRLRQLRAELRQLSRSARG
jgi:hypothetical protein